jgi:tetratricopeptide (TPR) repeat protein
VPVEIRDAIPNNILHDAVVAYRAGKLDEVEGLCKQILEHHPNHIAGLQLLAATVSKKGEPRRGIELSEKVVAIRPDFVDGYIHLARYLRVEGRILEAVTALKKAIELQPRSAEAYNDLGLIYLADINVNEATDCFTRAVEIKPELAIAHFNRGLAFEAQGMHDEAISCFRRVVTINTTFAEAYAKLGNLLLFEGDRLEAIDCFRRAAAAKPDTVLALTSQANILIEEGKMAAAEELMRRAIKLEPRNPQAYCLVGSIQMLLGRFHDAAVCYELALTLNPRETAAYCELVNVKKLTEADRSLVAQIEWILGKYKLGDSALSDLHFALGKAYDDLSEYHDAIQHYDQANRLKVRSTTFADSQYALVTDRIITKFNENFFSHNSALGSGWEVPLLIVGMPRSGTTLAEQILSRHPDVAAGGELIFWSERIDSFRVNASDDIDPAWVRDAAQDYRSLLTNISPTARRVIDKRPHNFQVIGFIHAVFPRARIIHCVRHPVDTCLSIYFQNFARRMDFSYDRDDLVSTFCQYHKLMAHWRNLLPEDRFLEVKYEELVSNPDKVTRDMVRFCGLEWNDACLHSEDNKRAVRTASVWQVRQPVYKTSVARWRNYEPWLGVFQSLLAYADKG